MLGAAAAIAAAGAFGYFKGHQSAAADAKAVMLSYQADLKQIESDAKDKVRELEQELAEGQVAISEAYERGKDDAEAIGAAVVADLRSGNARLRQRWTSCQAEHLPDASAASSEPDESTRDREESAGRIIRAAAQCDAQVRGLQALLMFERGLQPAVSLDNTGSWGGLSLLHNPAPALYTAPTP
jgi:hypothetical protein